MVEGQFRRDRVRVEVSLFNCTLANLQYSTVLSNAGFDRGWDRLPDE